MKRTRVLIASDIHDCQLEWYGLSNRERLERFVSDVDAEYRNDPYAALLLLGDYSLDHWRWNTKGCYLEEGISDTKDFVDTYFDRLVPDGVSVRMIAGNHEQYGDGLWNVLTRGFHRQDHLVVGDIVFVLLDTYAEHLDPKVHSDGTYSGADVDYIRAILNRYPDKKLILCSHFFAHDIESRAFKTLVREEARILCLFCGHNHKSRVISLGEEYGNKSMLYTGNYSYSGEKDDILRCPWGFRDLVITDEGIVSRYITPKNTYVLKDKTTELPYGYLDEFELRF